MKLRYIILIGFLATLTILFIAGNSEENGETNAIAMYFAVFLIPIFILTLLNGFFIKLISQNKNLARKIFLAALPVILLFIASLQTHVSLPFFDGDLSFLAKISMAGIIITNVLWIISLLHRKNSVSTV